MKTENYQVGDEIIDFGSVIGRIVSFVIDGNKGYFLIRNEKREYTLYYAPTGCSCRFSLVRFVPESVVRCLYIEAFMGEDCKPAKRVPVIGRPGTRREAIEISRKTLEDAENKRIEYAKEEAKIPVIEGEVKTPIVECVRIPVEDIILPVFDFIG